MQHLFRYKLTTLAISATLITGCSTLTRSEYQAPEVQVPQQWQQTSPQQPVLPDAWWEQFQDPELNQLIERVLETNNDLALATLTLREARLEAGVTSDDSLPQFSSSLSAEKEWKLKNRNSSNSYSASASVSYELDLWGRVSASIDAAKWSAMASAEDRESTAQSLVATAASLYWQIGYLNERLTLSEENLNDAKQTLTLTQKQYQSGAASRLDVLEARQSFTSLEISHSELKQQFTEANNALAILFNQPPQNMHLAITKLPDTPLPDIAAGIPADLLARRPDVKSALYELKSALASKDETASSYLPTLTLTGSIGDSSSQLEKLLQNPVGTLGAGLVLPFLQWNQMELNKQISEVQYQSTIVSYRKALYEAFEDVDNALSARQQYLYQGEKLKLQYEDAKAAERIYTSQYNNGAIGLTDLLDAQQDRRSTEASLLENRYNQYVVQSTLYQALGGSDIAPEERPAEEEVAEEEVAK